MADFRLKHLQRRYQKGELSPKDYIDYLEIQLSRLGGLDETTDMCHNWIPLHEDNSEYWCQRCGVVKRGPFSEPGAFNYFTYFTPGPPRKYTAGPGEDRGSLEPIIPWFERLGFDYSEHKADPPCPMLGVTHREYPPYLSPERAREWWCNWIEFQQGSPKRCHGRALPQEGFCQYHWLLREGRLGELE